MGTRLEKDSIGPKEIPAHVYYGVQTARAVENYPISGMRAHATLIRAIAMIKRASAEANKELGLVDAKVADAIIAAAQEVIDGKWDREFVVDVFQAGAGVSFHMNSNEVIANRAEEILGGRLGEYKRVHPNDHVNYGQSTNDVFPTAMRLATLIELEKLYPVLDAIAGSFDKKGKEFWEVMKSGRTHMQDAVPIRLGQEFAAYGLTIRKATANIRSNSEDLHELGLGGSAVGTGINTHPDYRGLAIAKLMRISGQKLMPAVDMRWAMQSNAPMAEISAALRNLALEIIRISNDILQSITIMTNMLRQFDKFCISGLTVNKERCRFYAESTVSLATALNPYIGYQKAAEIVKESVATGKSIIDIARSRGLLKEDEIAKILDPVNMTEPQRPLEAAKQREAIKAR
ncbi:MAG: aspartate ammonia-lyase [Acidobacteria bacterium]|nr:MAG: aspartate ammonia-lyase [Acidobacteriota bacterium]